MKAAHRAYARARRDLLVARASLPGPFVQEPGEELPPEVQAVENAAQALRDAETDVQAEFDAAWNRNREAVGSATAAFIEARREQARVETVCGNAARQRDPRHPVLNETERAAVTEARARVTAAAEALTAAQIRFKDGVTAEQLAGT